MARSTAIRRPKQPHNPPADTRAQENEFFMPPERLNDPFDSTRASRLAYQSVLSVLHGFATTLCIARSLASAEREIDLSGLHETAGLLCARALDLQPEHGRQLVPRLRSVLEDLDALHTTLAPARNDGMVPRA